jgi:hypothetical protein
MLVVFLVVITLCLFISYVTTQNHESLKSWNWVLLRMFSKPIFV